MAMFIVKKETATVDERRDKVYPKTFPTLPRDYSGI